LLPILMEQSEFNMMLGSIMKDVKNDTCAALGCMNPAKQRLILHLGFAAWFCKACAIDIIRDGDAMEESDAVK